MKRKILTAIYVILILILLKLLYSSLMNHILISKYDQGEYSDNQAKALTFLNFSESYIANYNYGNILYQRGEYEEAIEQYKKSLNDIIIPQDKECNIRINYALSICKTVQVDEKDETSIQEAIKKYESAIEILTLKGCANKEDNNGHNRQAQQLEKDIQKEIDRLKKLQKQENDNQDEQQENQDKNDKEETIETKIQEIKQDATKDQRKIENQFKKHDIFDFNKNQKNW